jgi:hypothetical protein
LNLCLSVVFACVASCANHSAQQPSSDPRIELANEGFVVQRTLGDPNIPNTFRFEILANPTTHETAYLAIGPSEPTPVFVMKDDVVERQLGAQTPNYVGMSQAALTEKMQQLLADPSAGGTIDTYYGPTNYVCCVQTCVNNNLSSVGCTGVGNLLPWCTQVAAIATVTCGIGCSNDAVACSLAPNCGCGPVCGDRICDLANGENCNNCSADCGACGSGGSGGTCLVGQPCAGGGGGGGCGSDGDICEDDSDCCNGACDLGEGICLPLAD